MAENSNFVVIDGSCTINVHGPTQEEITDHKLESIKNELSEKFTDLLDVVLHNHGISNEQIHSCIVDELTKEDEEEE